MTVEWRTWGWACFSPSTSLLTKGLTDIENWGGRRELEIGIEIERERETEERKRGEREIESENP